jgi:IclR family acetate operon transcriptional repressor
LAAIAEAAELGKPTAHRILQVLVRNNYAEARGDGAYAPGPAMRTLGGSGGPADLAATARPVLTELQTVTGHTVHFAVRAGRMATYVSKIEGDKPYQMASRIGMQIRLHCTSIGKAVLSALSPDELDTLLAIEGDESAGPPVDRAELDRQLKVVRKRGYSIDDQENEPNVRCVGAPVYGADGSVLGGVSVSGLAFVFSLKQAHACGPEVVEAAARLSKAFGYREGRSS